MLKVINSQLISLPGTGRICGVPREGLSALVLIAFPAVGGSPGRLAQAQVIAAEEPMGSLTVLVIRFHGGVGKG